MNRCTKSNLDPAGPRGCHSLRRHSAPGQRMPYHRIGGEISTMVPGTQN
jgi:hypothetical protein